ncbi:FkbM family methyltransferase [Halorubrum sp. SS5]|nr:FkbM family methyltransferase [Halorubrum sp. SS5]
MDLVKLASLIPKPVLQPLFNSFVAVQRARGENYFRCEWEDHHWYYVYENSESLTFFFDAKVTDGNTGREKIPLELFDDLSLNHDGMIDLGAHMGSVSVILGSLNPDIPLHCFEPAAENVEILRRNLEVNDIDASVEEAVAGTETGTITFYENIGGETRKLHLFDNSVNHTTSSVNAADSSFQQIEKPSINILSYCEENGVSRPFLKIDIEGAEYKIMDELLRGDHELEGFSAIVELHPDLIEDGHAHDIVLWLESQEVDIEWVKTKNPRRMALFCSTLE